MLDELKVTFLVRHGKQIRRREVDLMSVGDGLLDLKILYWDEAVMKAPADRPGVRFTPIDAQYASVKPRMGWRDCRGAERLFAIFDRYYLRWHGLDNGWRESLAALRDARC